MAAGRGSIVDVISGQRRRRAPRRAFVPVAVLALALLVVCSAPAVSVAQTDTCPNAGLRKGAGALLPDCRAYEQVSPPDKNGGDVPYPDESAYAQLNAIEANSVAADGGRVIFTANTEFAGASSGGGPNRTHYVAVRTDGGWTTAAMVPPLNPPAGNVSAILSSADLHRTLLNPSGAKMETNPPDTSDNTYTIYVRDNVFGNVTPFIGMKPTPGNQFVFSYPVASPDMAHVAFVANETLTDDAVPGDFNAKVYERVGGQTRLVSIRPDGTSADHAFLGSTGDIAADALLSTQGAMSSDGRHIFFNDSVYFGNPKELYRRSDGAVTVSASPSKRSSLDPEGVKTKTFRIASTDGRRVFFTSAQHLTDDANTGPSRAGEDLYRYDVDADELIDVSATADGGDGARVLGVLGASESGDRVYYAALGQVVPGEGSASGTEPNLYLWEDDGTPGGSTRFITTLSDADSANWRHLDARWTARASSAGDRLMFMSEAAVPGHDSGGVRQVYLYDSIADDGAGSLRCVSCNPYGDTPMGPATFPLHRGGNRIQRWEHVPVLSDDGSRVFFSTADDLVGRDSNGEIDPYMWEDGRLSLLSTGTSARPSFFYNATPSGDDAFIATADALVAQDVDESYDLYDARVGGGFPPPPPVASCADDECQGADAGVPPAGEVGSTRLRGAREAGAGVRLVLGLRAPSRAQRARLARGRKIGVRVRVSRAARVRVVVRARTAGGSRVVASGARRATRAGTVVVRVGLDRFAKRRLRRAGAVRLSFQARASGARSRSLNLRLRGAR